MRAEFSRSKTQLSDPLFHKLCKEDNLAKIGNILEQHPEYLNQQDQRLGLTLLANAVIYSKIEIIRFLLGKGADPNIQDFVGESPLHLAADNSDIEITELLLLAKAEPNCSTVDGETPLHHAAFKGDRKIIKLLLSYGADPNHADITLGRTPLHCAIHCEHIHCIKLLLSYGADPKIEDKDNICPIIACQNPEIQKLLLEWVEKSKKHSLHSIPEAGMSEEEKNSYRYSITQSVSSINFSITDSSFESLPSEVLPTQRYGSEDTTASFQMNKSPEDVRLLKFLKTIKLQAYKEILTKAGFDDLEMMTYQMISPLPITHQILESIGMNKHGHRSRLLMKLEQNAGVCPIGKIDEKSAIESSWECCQPKNVSPPGINSLLD